MEAFMGEWLTVRSEDGRELEVLRSGAADGYPLLWFGGTPSEGSGIPHVTRAVTDRNWQLVSYSRPGYAGSTVRPERTVADAAWDAVAVLDHLGLDRFVTLGWSGGGPHALACAALLPDRCAGAATLASVAPYDVEGLDWLNGMAPENHEEFGAAAESLPALTIYLEEQASGLANVTGEEVTAALGGLVSEVDREALIGELAESVAATMRGAVSAGIAGWRDDDIAFVKDWGFDVSAITSPVSIWQGQQDRMVPFTHGQWLAAHIPGARLHLQPDQGHLSLFAQSPRIIDDLEELASG
jgi:pimeloyl-ACP methyl ester carboxylesterase